ncbi:MAG: glycyl radical protein [Bacteroidota bacterium]|nr:glycyl radical protein [Bacteroidota bacterium]
MNNRIKKLREESLNAECCISAERALLVTEFYGSHNFLPEPVAIQRAKCFKYILENKAIYIGEDELIVGERGPAPKATPTYPEINLHSISDLDILNTRKKVWFHVEEETKEAYRNIIIPFWKGKTNRERIFSNVSNEWIEAYNAGIFTEFQEQRAPGHTTFGDKMFRTGMLDLQEEIKSALAALDFYNDPKAYERKAELQAMFIASQAIILFAERHAAKLEYLAAECKDAARRAELEKMAATCRRVPAHAPSTFHEALQHYWFIHLGVITEVNPWDSYNPGRLDRSLYPIYRKEIAAGTITREQAIELLEAFWIKFNNHPSPPKVGITAEESNTYTDFSLINLGGLMPDGSDAVNDLSYIMLDVIEEMRLLQPSSMVQISKKNPDRFLHRALRIVKTGFGQPSIFNTDAIVQELMRQGKDVVDARNGGASGCVESGAFGTEAYILSGYFNIPKMLELTLNDGVDPLTGKQLGLATGDPCSFSTFDELFEAFRKQLNHFIDIKIQGNNIIHSIFASHIPVPFLSLLTQDCIKNGRDYNGGGARYNTTYIQGVGLGSITDSLAAIKYHIYDKKALKMIDFLRVLHDNFDGAEALLLDLIYKTPKYGNDDDYADSLAREVFDIYYNAINGRPTSIGGVHRINLLPTTCHVYFGYMMGAMPDGRKAHQPLSEGISPVQGCDTKGPTAVIRSAAKLDHIRTGGTLLNQKFSPSFFEDEESISKLGSLVRSYFRMDGHHIQFNVVSVETLLDAQKHPEKYRDLIVRVAGYSDYFNDLGVDLQNEIIKRTAHEAL